jgi:3-oxoacyl-[acyl-carrier protein] reductase
MRGRPPIHLSIEVFFHFTKDSDFSDKNRRYDRRSPPMFLSAVMRTFRGKRAVITGAASGIGKAIAIELAKARCHTCLLDVDGTALEQTVQEVKELGVEALGFTCDVGDKDAVEAALSRTLAVWPELDILVNNAGVTYRGRSVEMVPSDWERLLAINLLGPIQICQRLLPVLLRRPEAHVLNVSSLLGLCGVSKFAAYNASKFGLVGYSEALRAEHLSSQLGVSVVCPGFVRTPFIEAVPGAQGMLRQRSVSHWLSTTPEVVARKSLQAIRKNRGLVVVTPLAHLAWRLKRFVPALFELPRLLKPRRITPGQSSRTRHASSEASGPLDDA